MDILGEYALKSCMEHQAIGKTETDDYLIDPDANEMQPFLVTCDMNRDPQDTIVHHNFETRTLVSGE